MSMDPPGSAAPGAWRPVAASVLRTATTFACVLGPLAATTTLTLHALETPRQAGEGNLQGDGYADTFLPTVRDDLTAFPGALRQASGLAATDPAAAADLLAKLAAHERDALAAATAQPVPRAFEAAHRDLLALYADAAQAAQDAADCLAARDPLLPACQEALRLQETIPGAVEQVLQKMQDAADGVQAPA
ncbi:MAG: hypothetical protein ABR586_01100 [Thermoplasmatota archaeon]